MQIKQQLGLDTGPPLRSIYPMYLDQSFSNFLLLSLLIHQRAQVKDFMNLVYTLTAILVYTTAALHKGQLTVQGRRTL